MNPRSIFLALSLLTLGCGNATAPPGNLSASDTQCTQGSAAIQVGDGFFRIYCGCVGTGEADGTVFPAPGNLTCKLSSSTSSVFFYYLGTVQAHRIVPVGSPSFIASPLSDPQNDRLLPVHPVVQFQSGAVTKFRDDISGMTGQITVP